MNRQTLATVGLLIFCSTAVSGHVYQRPTSSETTLQSDAVPWDVLRSFENKDLRKLDNVSKTRLQKAIRKLIGESDYDRIGQLFILHLFAKISNSQQQTRYVLIEESTSLGRPSHPSLRVSVLDLEGKLLNSSVFDAGSRILITSLAITTASETGREVIVVNTKSDLWGTQRAQYYALVGDDVKLIRIEHDRR